MDSANISQGVAHHLMNLILAGILMSCFPACDEPDLRISAADDGSPTFRFSGNGYLDFFAITEIAPETQTSAREASKNRIIWQIFPQSTQQGKMPVPPITYGKVPPGFIQRIPENGEPAQLVEGKLYQAGAPPMVHPRGFIRFVIKGGKLVIVE